MPPRRSFIQPSTWQRATDLETSDMLEQGLANLKLPSLLEDGITGLKDMVSSFEMPAFEPVRRQQNTVLPMVATPMPEIRPIKAPDYTQEFAEYGVGPDGEAPSRPSYPAPASGTPQAMPQGSAPAQTGDLRAYTRAKAASLGIDPDIAEQVALSEGGFDNPVRQSDVIYQGKREESYGPFQLNVNGGLGATAIQRGHDPRDPANVYRNIDFALEEAARGGWGPYHGAARVGIGPRQGIGAVQPGPAPAAPRPGAVPAEQTTTAQAQAPTRLQGITPEQFGLGDADAEAICGPVLAMAFARSHGRNPTIAEAKQMAAQHGSWTRAQGMGGPEAMANTLRSMGIPATYKPGALDIDTIRRETQNGNPVGINTQGHYFVVEGVDAEGRLDLGNSAKALRASKGRQWFYPQEIASLGMGGPTGAIYKDAPSSPTPSVAVRETGLPPVGPNAGAAPSPAPAAPPAPVDGLSPSAGAPVRDDWRSQSAPIPQAQMSDLDAARTATGAGDVMLRNPLDEQPSDAPIEGGMPPPRPPDRDDWRVEAPIDPDQGPREATPGSVGAQPYLGPLSPTPEPVVPPPPAVTITNGGPPSPAAQFVPVETRPRGVAPAVRAAGDMAEAGGRFIDQSIPSPPGWQAIVDGAGNVVDWVRERVADVTTPSYQPTPTIGEELAPRPAVYGPDVPPPTAIQAVQNARAGLPTNTRPPVVSTPGEPDYVPPRPSVFGPGGILEPAGGLPRVTERMLQIQENAARELGRNPNDGRVVYDRTWRANNPEMAEEYDALSRQLGLVAAGQVGDAARMGRGPARATVEVIREQLDAASRAGDMGAVARLESDLVDAMNARRRAEPAIESDVGRRIERTPIDERTTEDFSTVGRERAQMAPEELSGPVGVPVDMSGRANATTGALPASPTRPGVLPAVNRAASEAIVGGTGGAVIEQARNPDEEPRTAAARGFAAGMVGFPVATRLARGAARVAGAGSTPGGGAYAALGSLPPSRPTKAPGRTFAFGATPGERLEFDVKVIPLSSLVTSHTDNLAINRAFPSELQPRVRERAASQIQIDKIIKTFDPDQLLVDTHRVDSGPMIVGADNVVESGNGRSIALRRLAKEDPEAYARYVETLKAELPEYGLTEDALRGIDQPVLVRERVTPMTPEQRAQYAAEANVGTSARMAPVEQAAQDAGRLSDESVARIVVGEDETIDEALMAAENGAFRRAFMATVPESEWGQLLTGEGNLNPQGLARVKDALLAKTYRGSAGARLATAFVDSLDSGIKNVQHGIMGSLPTVARTEARIAAGELDPALSITDDMARAADVYSRLRRRKTILKDYIAQSGMFEGRETTPFQDRILAYIDENARAPKRIRALLEEYARTVDGMATSDQVDMFGAPARQMTKDEVLNDVLRRLGTDVGTDTSADLGRVGAGGDVLEGTEPGATGVPRPAAGAPDAGSAGSTGVAPDGPATGQQLTPEQQLARFNQARAPQPPASAPLRGANLPPVADDIAPVGGPEGALRSRVVDDRSVRADAEVPDIVPTGGPEGRLRAADLVPPEVDAVVRKRFAKPEKAEEVLAHYAAMKADGADEVALHKFLNAATGAWSNRVGILRFAGMLSSTYSQATNTLGTGLQVAGDVVGVVPAVAADVVRAGVTRGEREVFLAELPARKAAMQAAHAQAAADARFTFLHGIRPEDISKLDHLRGGFGTNIPGLAPVGSRRADVIDFAVEYPLRLLAASDVYFRSLAQAGHLAAEATARAIKEGNGRADPARVAELMTDKGLMNQAEALARKTVLQEDRRVTSWIRQTIDKAPPPARMVAEALLPFVRTPYNIVAQGVEMSPIGAAKALWDASHGKMTNRELSDRLAKAAVGTTIGAIGYALAVDGHVTGAYPEDAATRSTLPPGWRPFSAVVNLPNGETRYVPLATLGPLAIPASLGAILGAAKQNGQEIDPASVAESVGRFAEDQTFLRSLFDGVEAFRRGGNALENYVEQVASSYSPHVIGGGALGRQIQQAMGMAPRDPEGAIEALMATFPYTAGRVPSRLDVLGRETTTAPSGGEAMIPNVRSSIERDEPVIAAFRGAGQGLPRQAPPTLRDPDTERSVTLTREQKAQWRVAFGQALQDSWSAQGRPRRGPDLQKIEREARERARDAVLRR